MALEARGGAFEVGELKQADQSGGCGCGCSQCEIGQALNGRCGSWGEILSQSPTVRSPRGLSWFVY